MSNPPPIAFTIPFAPVAVGFVVNANGVLPDGTNPGVPDVTSPLVIAPFTGPTAYSAAIDPSNNRRIIVTPGLLPPSANPPATWSFKVSVTGRPLQVTVSGTTQAPADVSGVSWDGTPVQPL